MSRITEHIQFGWRTEERFSLVATCWPRGTVLTEFMPGVFRDLGLFEGLDKVPAVGHLRDSFRAFPTHPGRKHLPRESRHWHAGNMTGPTQMTPGHVVVDRFETDPASNVVVRIPCFPTCLIVTRHIGHTHLAWKVRRRLKRTSVRHQHSEPWSNVARTRPT